MGGQDGWRRGRRFRFLVPVAVTTFAVIAATGCSGATDDSTAPSSVEDAAGPETSSEPTSTSTSTTTATTASTATEASDEDAVVAEMMETVTDYGRAYGTCLADPAACDVEADLGSFLGQPLRGQVDGAVSQWATDGVQLRGFTDEQYFHQRHELALAEPPTYALEICVVTGPQAVYQVSADGSESLVQDLGGPSVQFRQLLLERQSDGGYVINVSQAGDEAVEGTECDGDQAE